MRRHNLDLLENNAKKYGKIPYGANQNQFYRKKAHYGNIDRKIDIKQLIGLIHQLRPSKTRKELIKYVAEIIIDGEQVENINVDGEEVQEVTIDGETVFSPAQRDLDLLSNGVVYTMPRDASEDPEPIFDGDGVLTPDYLQWGVDLDYIYVMEGSGTASSEKAVEIDRSGNVTLEYESFTSVNARGMAATENGEIHYVSTQNLWWWEGDGSAGDNYGVTSDTGYDLAVNDEYAWWVGDGENDNDLYRFDRASGFTRHSESVGEDFRDRVELVMATRDHYYWFDRSESEIVKSSMSDSELWRFSTTNMRRSEDGTVDPEGNIYWMINDPNRGARVYKLFSDGSEISWNYTFDSDEEPRPESISYGEEDDAIYASSEDEVVKLDAETGEEIWKISEGYTEVSVATRPDFHS